MYLVGYPQHKEEDTHLNSSNPLRFDRYVGTIFH